MTARSLSFQRKHILNYLQNFSKLGIIVATCNVSLSRLVHQARILRLEEHSNKCTVRSLLYYEHICYYYYEGFTAYSKHSSALEESGAGSLIFAKKKEEF